MCACALVFYFFLFFRSADWNDCAVKAAARVQDQSGFDLLDTAPSSPQNGSDSDSDDDCCCTGEGGGEGEGVSVVPWWGKKDEDEEGGFGYYGGGGRGGPAVVSGTERKEWVHAGEGSKLVAAAPRLPRPWQF